MECRNEGLVNEAAGKLVTTCAYRWGIHILRSQRNIYVEKKRKEYLGKGEKWSETKTAKKCGERIVFEDFIESVATSKCSATNFDIASVFQGLLGEFKLFSRLMCGDR